MLIRWTLSVLTGNVHEIDSAIFPGEESYNPPASVDSSAAMVGLLAEVYTPAADTPEGAYTSDLDIVRGRDMDRDRDKEEQELGAPAHSLCQSHRQPRLCPAPASCSPGLQ